MRADWIGRPRRSRQTDFGCRVLFIDFPRVKPRLWYLCLIDEGLEGRDPINNDCVAVMKVGLSENRRTWQSHTSSMKSEYH